MQSRDLRLLMISRDSSLAQKDSPTFLRHLEYAERISELHILLICSSTSDSPLRKGNLRIYPWHYFPYLVFNAGKLGINYITAQDPLYSGMIGYFFRLFHKLPWQIQVHGDFLGNKYWLGHNLINILWQKFALYFLSKADNARVVSKRILKNLAKLGVDEKKIVVLPIYTGLVNVGETKKEKIILYAGRIEWEKNVEWLIRSWVELARKYPEWKLVIVGEGSLKRSLMMLAEEIGAGGRVEWYGWTNDLAQFYSKASIFVLPSFFEGWGRSVIEALNYGCAVIMSNVGLAGEIIRNQENGIVVDLVQKDSLVLALERLINDDEYRHALVVMGQKAVDKLIFKEEYLKQWADSF